MSGGIGGRSYDYFDRRSSLIEDEDGPDENESEEDHTARFDEWMCSFATDAANASALQRVKSLTQRNRMVCPGRPEETHILTHFVVDHLD